MSEYSQYAGHLSNFISYQNGVQYKIYVPENYDANTPVAVYCHGGGDYQIDYPSAFLNQNGNNAVIIMPNAQDEYMETANYARDVVNIVNNVKQDLSITNDTLSVAGFSFGSTPAYRTMGEYLKQNPNCSSQTLFLLDNYPRTNALGTGMFNSLLQEYGDYYKSNDTLFVSLFPQYGSDGKYIYGSKQVELDYLASYGMNVAVLHSYKSTHPGAYNLSSGAGSHGILEQAFWLDGFYNMLADKGLEIEPDQYHLTILNKQTGKYEQVDISKLNSLDKLREYFGIDISSSTSTTTEDDGYFLKKEIDKLNGLNLYKLDDKYINSDYGVVVNNVNNILTGIKSTAFVQNGLKLGFGGESTTKVPSSLPNIMGVYFTCATNILTNLSDLTAYIEKSAKSIVDNDQELAQNAESVNDDVFTVNTNGTAVNLGNRVQTGANTGTTAATVAGATAGATTLGATTTGGTTSSNPTTYYSSGSYTAPTTSKPTTSKPSTPSTQKPAQQEITIPKQEVVLNPSQQQPVQQVQPQQQPQQVQPQQQATQQQPVQQPTQQNNPPYIPYGQDQPTAPQQPEQPPQSTIILGEQAEPDGPAPGMPESPYEPTPSVPSQPSQPSQPTTPSENPTITAPQQQESNGGGLSPIAKFGIATGIGAGILGAGLMLTKPKKKEESKPKSSYADYEFDNNVGTEVDYFENMTPSYDYANDDNVGFEKIEYDFKPNDTYEDETENDDDDFIYNKPLTDKDGYEYDEEEADV